jgi:alkaline phosphatase D
VCSEEPNLHTSGNSILITRQAILSGLASNLLYLAGMKYALPVVALAMIFACKPQETKTPNTTTDSPRPISVIAFGSCAEQYKPQPVLQRVVEKKPDLFIYLGDNIYSDTRSMDTLRKNYQILRNKPEFQALKSQVPILATWDDHDYGWNDTGRHYPFKKESKSIFLDFFGVPDSSVLDHDGIYYSKLFTGNGRVVQLIFPDMRTFRDKILPYNGSRNGQKGYDYELDYSPYTTSDSTMLGEEQWKWMEQQLRIPADLRIICSSTQFGITHNGYEAWANFPHEQKRMTDLIRKTKAEGVVFISGDVHYAEISRLSATGVYPIYDVTASGITSTWDFATPNDNRIDGPVMENHFGLITINWEEQDPSVKMEIHDVDGKLRISREIHLSELKFPAN